jgi:hypothetical protein
MLPQPTGPYDDVMLYTDLWLICSFTADECCCGGDISTCNKRNVIKPLLKGYTSILGTKALQPTLDNPKTNAINTEVL